MAYLVCDFEGPEMDLLETGAHGAGIGDMKTIRPYKISDDHDTWIKFA